jgi:hypothetical protein
MAMCVKPKKKYLFIYLFVFLRTGCVLYYFLSAIYHSCLIVSVSLVCLQSYQLILAENSKVMQFGMRNKVLKLFKSRRLEPKYKFSVFIYFMIQVFHVASLPGFLI